MTKDRPFSTERLDSNVELLVSVREASEVQPALHGGADWLDLKQPNAGALGPVSMGQARRIIAAAAGRAQMISAAGGELLQWPSSTARQLATVRGVSHLKLGLAGCRHIESWPMLWHATQVQLAARGKRLVLVAYADAAQARAPSIAEVFALANAVNPDSLLIDTWDKNGPCLTELIAPSTLASGLRGLRAGGVRTVVAGRLTAQQIARLPLEEIDVIAVRGAACRGGRQGEVSADRVRRLRDVLSTVRRPWAVDCWTDRRP